MFHLVRYNPNPTPDEQLHAGPTDEWPAVWFSREKAQEVADRLNARGEADGGWVVEEF
jgi:hypothetical protein